MTPFVDRIMVLDISVIFTIQKPLLKIITVTFTDQEELLKIITVTLQTKKECSTLLQSRLQTNTVVVDNTFVSPPLDVSPCTVYESAP